jgi:hypothetical protein
MSAKCCISKMVFDQKTGRATKFFNLWNMTNVFEQVYALKHLFIIDKESPKPKLILMDVLRILMCVRERKREG